MIHLNFGITALAALIPLVLGFIWYNPKFLGNAWMQACGLDEEKIKGANMPLIFGLTYLLSFLSALALNFITIHQFSFFSILANEPGLSEAGSPINTYFTDFMSKYGTNFRTFKHGAFHGIITGFMLATPVLAINALFERKGFKYIAINAGYWIISFAIMGGIICAFA